MLIPQFSIFKGYGTFVSHHVSSSLGRSHIYDVFMKINVGEESKVI